MKNTYYDLVAQTFDFPQDGFSLKDNRLLFNNIDIYELIQKYGTPLKLTYLPKIGEKIQTARKLFRMPRRGISLQAFLPAARAMAAEAEKRRELLIGEGLPETFGEDLNTALEGYAEAVSQKNSGRASHVGARADLRALTKEMGLLVRRLDSINRYRFRNDAELLAAWNSVQDMSWPSSGKAGPAGGTAAA